MGLLLFADEVAPKSWWFAFADGWGNTASVAGLIITVVAFPVTWGIQARIRRASQEAVLRVALVVLSASVDDLLQQLTTAREAGRLGLWQRAFDACHQARRGALRLAGNPHLIWEEKNALRAGADDLTLVIEYIEGNKLGAKASPAFQHDKRKRLDAFVELTTRIQTRLGTRTWEV